MWLLTFLLLAQTPATTAPATANAPAATTAAGTQTITPVPAKATGTGNTSTAQTTDTPANPPATRIRGAVEVLKSLYERFIDYLPHLVSALLILVVGWTAAGWSKRFLRRVMASRHVDLTLSSFLSNLCYWLTITVVVVVALSNAKFETTPFTAVLGASALAVGLALQSSLSNFAAGVLIILFRHFRVGDEIETGSVKGVVEEISIFNTTLRTADNREIIVPNGSILNTPVTNNSAKPTRRLDIVFNISYGSDLRQARQHILEIVKKDTRMLSEPEPVVVVSNLGESSVDLTLRAWVSTGDYGYAKEAMLEAVKLRFDETGIDIPFPQHEVHVRQIS